MLKVQCITLSGVEHPAQYVKRQEAWRLGGGGKVLVTKMDVFCSFLNSTSEDNRSVRSRAYRKIDCEGCLSRRKEDVTQTV